MDSPMLTPQNVPRFVIPGNSRPVLLSPFKRCTAYRRFPSNESKPTEDLPPSPTTASPGRRLLDSYRFWGRKSAAEQMSIRLRAMDRQSYSDSTDPGYKLAMSLLHVPKKETPYGFLTLCTTPQTTRKESLFFSRGRRGASTLNPRNSASFCSDVSDSSANCSSASSPMPPQSRSQAADRRLSRCRTSQLELPDDDNPLTQESMRNWAKSPRKRRSGIQLAANMDRCGREEHDSDADYSPLDDSLDPNRRRRWDKSARRMHTEESPKEIDRTLTLQQLHLNCARQQQTIDLGGLEVALWYDASVKRLWVLLIHGENIGQGGGLPPSQVCSFVKLQICPKQPDCQIHRSETAKNTSDPSYDEEFAFENVNRGVIKNSRLRLQVFQERWIRRGLNVGEIWLDLQPLDQEGYMHCHRDLKPKCHFVGKEPRRLNVALSYRPDKRILMVVVVQAKNVHSIVTGYRVEVELTQVSSDHKSLETGTAHTRVHRGFTSSHVFKEAFSFRLNETQNIRDGLTLVCRVVPARPYGSGNPIGQVQFGVGSTQKSEMDHWASLLRGLGRPVTQWHTLV